MPRLRHAALALLLSSFAAPSPAHAQTRPGTSPARPRLTKPPELLEFVEATYPESEAASGRTATVVLQLAIAADGTVSEAAVLESAGAAFDSAALDAVRRFKFSPAEIDDKPAPVKITYRYQFTQKVVAPTTGGFHGAVVAKGSGAPLVGVTVEIAGVGSQVTDANGAFAFDELPPGPVRVSLSREDLTTLQTEETVEVGHTLEARYDVELPSAADAESEEEKDDFEVVVRAPRLVKQVVSTEV
ncbi:MAG TPA: TonB family protein, partial [Polyangiaceae bacterium]|nr:TonB family protein [Polyangiaceae bacterium]